jgi:hypothetical protein
VNARIKAAAATLGLTAMLGLGVAGGHEVFAQTTGTPTPSIANPAAERDAAKADAYAAFVENLAIEMGSDAATVDAAIRAALKQSIDDQVAAGDLAVNDATEMKAAIDTSSAPMMVGGRHFGGEGWGVRGGHRDGRGGMLPPSDESIDDDEATEAGTPAASIDFTL